MKRNRINKRMELITLHVANFTRRVCHWCCPNMCSVQRLHTKLRYSPVNLKFKIRYHSRLAEAETRGRDGVNPYSSPYNTIWFIWFILQSINFAAIAFATQISTSSSLISKWTLHQCIDQYAEGNSYNCMNGKEFLPGECPWLVHKTFGQIQQSQDLPMTSTLSLQHNPHGHDLSPLKGTNSRKK